MKKIFIISGVFLLYSIWSFGPIFFDKIHKDNEFSERARVIEILSDRQDKIPVLDTVVRVQEVKAILISSGKEILFTNDHLPLSLEDRVYVKRDFQGDENSYLLQSIDRRVGLCILASLFILCVIYFSGIQGIKSLASLIVGVFVVYKVLVPSIIGGFNPVLISVLVSSFVLFVAIFMTHGFNRGSLVAFLGTISSVVLTGALAYISVEIMKLSGLASDEAVYLNFNTFGGIDLSGLLLGGMIIGALGVLDDVAITQVSLVKQLISSNRGFVDSDIYKMAMHVGRDHIGAMINTIALAYLGSSLALVLFLYTSEMSWLEIINHEAVTTEIVRTLVGSIGLVLSVPITTYLAVRFIK